MTLYLVRHGQTDWNKEPRLQGQKDIPMNDEGIRQMKELADKLVEIGIKVDAIISSPLERAKTSAQIVVDRIGYTESIIVDVDFSERNFGLLEGTVWKPELNLEDPQYQAESASDLCDRAKKALDKYTFTENTNVMIVSHGAMLAAVKHALCAVLKALEDGDLSKERYNSYIKITREAYYARLGQDVGERIRFKNKVKRMSKNERYNK